MEGAIELMIFPGVLVLATDNLPIIRAVNGVRDWAWLRQGSREEIYACTRGRNGIFAIRVRIEGIQQPSFFRICPTSMVEEAMDGIFVMVVVVRGYNGWIDNRISIMGCIIIIIIIIIIIESMYMFFSLLFICYWILWGTSELFHRLTWPSDRRQYISGVGFYPSYKPCFS